MSKWIVLDLETIIDPSPPKIHYWCYIHLELIILSHMVRCSRIYEPLIRRKRRRRCIECKLEVESSCPEHEVEATWMSCCFIVPSKYSIFLNHFDSLYPSQSQKLNCLLVFFPIDLVLLPLWGVISGLRCFGTIVMRLILLRMHLLWILRTLMLFRY